MSVSVTPMTKVMGYVWITDELVLCYLSISANPITKSYGLMFESILPAKLETTP